MDAGFLQQRSTFWWCQTVSFTMGKGSIPLKSMFDILDLTTQALSRMSTDSPSRVIDWFEGFASDFDLEFDSTNQADLQRYCDELALYQRQASFNLVHPGLAFDVTIKSHEPPSVSMYRPLPLFALKGGEFCHVITTGIQNELDRLS